MFSLPIPIQIFPLFLVLFVTLWPIILPFSSEEVSSVIIVIMSLSFLVSIALLVTVWRFCSSPYISFWYGMTIVSAKLSSGCFNFSVLYLPAVLIVIYFIAIVYTLIGIFKGREWSQVKWIHLIEKTPSLKGTI